jgi:hypothetical protein
MFLPSVQIWHHISPTCTLCANERHSPVRGDGVVDADVPDAGVEGVRPFLVGGTVVALLIHAGALGRRHAVLTVEAGSELALAAVGGWQLDGQLVVALHGASVVGGAGVCGRVTLVNAHWHENMKMRVKWD